jgi:hypothetical protein
MRQPLAFWVSSWAALKRSRAQKMGSQRSASGEARLARCAELMTRTAWNL